MKNTLLALSIAFIFSIFTLASTDNWVKTVVISSLTGTFHYENEAAAFFSQGVTVAQLQQKYNSVPSTNKKVKILLVPGHEPYYGGAEYRNLKEREMNVAIVAEIAKLLQNNPRYEVIVPRDNNAWTDAFSNYFKDNWSEIRAFTKSQKDHMSQLMYAGKIKKIDNTVVHNTAPTDVATRLYGINKWANENSVDLEIHVHFNDNPRRNTSAPGEYSGFTIYVPDGQYSNSGTTKRVADAIFQRLSKYNATSDLPKESSGIVEDQDLIAIGSANTADAPSLLIEYGYIYEPVFQDAVARAVIFRDMAFETYLGIQDFFGVNDVVVKSHDTIFLPHSWISNFSKKTAGMTEDLLALQTAFIAEGLYPPKGETKNSCPRGPNFGPCTTSALNAFQDKYGIKGEEGLVGDKTRAKLNDLYSLQLM